MNDEQYEIPLFAKILLIIPFVICKIFLWGAGIEK